MITFGLLNLLLNVLKQVQIFHLFSCFAFYAGGQFLLLIVFNILVKPFMCFWMQWSTSCPDKLEYLGHQPATDSSSSVADVF